MSSPSPESAVLTGTEPATVTEPVAVVDIGTSSIRMAVAEISPTGEFSPLERLSQPVSLGKDTFTRGVIRKRTMEECVRVLRNYSRLLAEYRITNPSQMRVVATSAVREASNRLAFIDRIYSATGMEIDVLDEAEVTRTTYLGILPWLQSRSDLLNSTTVVTEVGGGSTEVLVVENSDVGFSHSYRLGSLRLREMLESYQAPTSKIRPIMESQIDRLLRSLPVQLADRPVQQLLALGGDIRFAANQLDPTSDPDGLTRLSRVDLARFTDQVLALSVDELVQKHHLSYPEAETLGPALLAYVKLAEILDLKTVLVSNVNLRNGLLRDLSAHGPWAEVLKRQIINSALDLARKFQVDEKHARHVAHLTSVLFHAYRDEHQLDLRYELILYLGAMLHEVGQFVSTNSFHKHTLYLIRNSELFGVGKSDLLLIALVARYHRRASPKPGHDGFGNLDREKRVAVSKMAAILRVADALDRSRSQRIDEMVCTREGNRWVISVPGVDDLSLEQMALEQKGGLFQEIFGSQVLLRRLRR